MRVGLRALVGSLTILSVLLCCVYGEPPAKPPSNDASGVSQLESKIDSLKDQVGLLEKENNLLRQRQDMIVDAAQKSAGQVQNNFLIVGGVFSLFTGITLFMQFREQSRRDKMENQNLEQVGAVMDKFKGNIDTINGLMVLIQSTLKSQKDVDERIVTVDKRIKDLDASNQREEAAFISKLEALNFQAAETFKKCRLQVRDREAFKQEDNRLLLIATAGCLTTLENVGNTKFSADPVSLLVRGLSRFNAMEYEYALKDLSKAKDLAYQLLKSPAKAYGSWTASETEENLRIIEDEVPYHLGIIHYNLGNYVEAKSAFLECFKRNPLDFRSRIYIPELMFFEDAIDPQGVIGEFAAVEAELNRVDLSERPQMRPTWESQYASLKMRLGNLYLPKEGFRAERRSGWSKLENAETAASHFWMAKDKAPDWAFVAFSLAQAMTSDQHHRSWRGTTPIKLFEESFNSFKKAIDSKTEPLLLTTQYYCAAICCFYLKRPGDMSSVYLMQARTQLQKIPKSIRIFSPINKINLRHEELAAELTRLEQSWQKPG